VDQLASCSQAPSGQPATISGWRDALNAWLLPHLGGKLLADVSNKTVRELVEKMAIAGLSAKTIVNYVQVVKLVLASAVDEEGEQIYPRKWNHDFIQLHMVRKDKHNRFRTRLPFAPRPSQPLAWAGTGAKNVERCARRGHSRGSRKRTL
jgi:hypothetical protein